MKDEVGDGDDKNMGAKCLGEKEVVLLDIKLGLEAEQGMMDVEEVVLKWQSSREVERRPWALRLETEPDKVSMDGEPERKQNRIFSFIIWLFVLGRSCIGFSHLKIFKKLQFLFIFL